VRGRSGGSRRLGSSGRQCEAAQRMSTTAEIFAIYVLHVAVLGPEKAAPPRESGCRFGVHFRRSGRTADLHIDPDAGAAQRVLGVPRTLSYTDRNAMWRKSSRASSWLQHWMRALARYQRTQEKQAPKGAKFQTRAWFVRRTVKEQRRCPRLGACCSDTSRRARTPKSRRFTSCLLQF